jgi:hypothetical protein
MRESQYVESYLYAASRRRWTPKTYLHYELRGRAKRYGAGYASALQRALDRRVRAGSVIPVHSVGRKIAYMWTEDAQQQEIAPVEAEHWITLLRLARERAAELLPVGIRPLTSEEYHLAWESIWKQDAEPVLRNFRPPEPEKLPEPVAAAVRAALGDSWDRLPVMPGNPHGYLGWDYIYRVGERLVVTYCGCTMLQGISAGNSD